MASLDHQIMESRKQIVLPQEQIDGMTLRLDRGALALSVARTWLQRPAGG